MKKVHEGSDFDDFLRDEGIFEEVEAAAIKKVIASMIATEMEKQHISKSAMASRIGTSRSAFRMVFHHGVDELSYVHFVCWRSNRPKARLLRANRNYAVEIF